MTTVPTDHPIAVSVTSAIHEGRADDLRRLLDGAHDLAGWLHERGARSGSGA